MKKNVELPWKGLGVLHLWNRHVEGLRDVVPLLSRDVVVVVVFLLQVRELVGGEHSLCLPRLRLTGRLHLALKWGSHDLRFGDY